MCLLHASLTLSLKDPVVETQQTNHNTETAPERDDDEETATRVSREKRLRKETAQRIRRQRAVEEELQR